MLRFVFLFLKSVQYFILAIFGNNHFEVSSTGFVDLKIMASCEFPGNPQLPHTNVYFESTIAVNMTE